MSMDDRFDHVVANAPGNKFSEETKRVYAYPDKGDTVSNRKEMTDYFKLHTYAYDTYGSFDSAATSKYNCGNCFGKFVVRFKKGIGAPGTVQSCIKCTCKLRLPTPGFSPGATEYMRLPIYKKSGTKSEQDYEMAVTGALMSWIKEKKKVRVIRKGTHNQKQSARTCTTTLRKHFLHPAARSFCVTTPENLKQISGDGESAMM